MRACGSLRILAFGLAAGIMAIGVSGHARAQAATPSTGNTPTITIGYVNWTEAVAVTHLMQAVLQNKFNYRVDLKLVGVEAAFRGVANGELDAFLDVWLPRTHGNYWDEYGGRSTTWVPGTRAGRLWGLPCRTTSRHAASAI